MAKKSKIAKSKKKPKYSTRKVRRCLYVGEQEDI